VTDDNGESRFISGIYNYCDRWCERCTYVNRCRLWHEEQARNVRHLRQGKDPDDWDVVMEDVSDSFQQTIQMLHEMAEEMGIDLEGAAEGSTRSLSGPRSGRTASVM
jgi:hypothetical protein